MKIKSSSANPFLWVLTAFAIGCIMSSFIGCASDRYGRNTTIDRVEFTFRDCKLGINMSKTY